MGFFRSRETRKEEYVQIEYSSYTAPRINYPMIRESMDIMEKTVNPETFFSREKLVSNALCSRITPEIVWKDMTCEEIYRTLNTREKRDAFHRRFIDRLFVVGKEDNMTYKLNDVSGYMSTSTIEYFVKKLGGKKYHFCKIAFYGTDKLYTYVTKDRSIKPGDSVTIPTGNEFVPDSKLKQVVEVFDASLEELGFPPERLRCIEEKLKSISCPHCGANIEIDVGQKVGRCTRCQSEFYLVQ